MSLQHPVVMIGCLLLVVIATLVAAALAVRWVERATKKGSPQWYAQERQDAREALKERIARSLVFDLYREGHGHLLDGVPYYHHPSEGLIPLREDVKEWLNANMRGWGRIPLEVQPNMGGAIFIENEDDALHFKMRWY